MTRAGYGVVAAVSATLDGAWQSYTSYTIDKGSHDMRNPWINTATSYSHRRSPIAWSVTLFLRHTQWQGIFTHPSNPRASLQPESKDEAECIAQLVSDIDVNHDPCTDR